MRDVSHTLIGTVHIAVEEWRRRNNWSRETVTQEIVKKFYELGGDQVTGISFNPETTDIIQRQKVMADKVFRWLDDKFKDTNFLPANFLPYILAALPMDLRIECVDEILRPVGFVVRITHHSTDQNLVVSLQHMAKEVGEGVAAFSGVLNIADRQHLLEAEIQITEAVDSCNECLELIESRLLEIGK